MATDVSQDRLAGAWTFGLLHSAATFTISYVVAPFRGEFERFSAELVDGRLSGSVDVTSINVKERHFAAHLQGPEFFDAERFPEISFSSDEIRITGDDVVLDGEITLKGVTKPIRATGTISGPTEDFRGETRLGLTLTATIDRTEHGIAWNAPLPKGGKALSDEVKLSVELDFAKDG